jgi:hypothetical protein
MIELLEKDEPPGIIIDKTDTLSFMEGILDRDAGSVDGLPRVLPIGGGSFNMVYYPFSSKFCARGRLVSLVLDASAGMAQ